MSDQYWLARVPQGEWDYVEGWWSAKRGDSQDSNTTDQGRRGWVDYWLEVESFD